MTTTTPGKSLRQRAAGDVTAQAPRATLQDQIRQMEQQFGLAMPKGVEAAQLVRDALTAVRATPGLLECDPQSVLGGLMTCAQLGLRVGVLGQAWLLPFYDKRSRGKKAQIIIGYQGLAELAYRSDRIASVIARTVHANDTFRVEFGTEDRIVHEPNMLGDRGPAVAYYCVVHIKDGRPVFFVMSDADMRDYRDKFATARNREGAVVGPWRDNFEGMAHKTCLRQLAKWLPKSTEFARALSVDEGFRLDVQPTEDPEGVTMHPDFIEGETVADTGDSAPGGTFGQDQEVPQ